MIIFIILNLITIISSYFHMKYIIHKTKINKYEPLPDILIDNCLPDLSKSKITHFLVDILLPISFLPIILSKRYDLFIFLYKIISIVFFLRAITKVSTIIPSQGNGCKNDVNNLMCYITGYCNDKIFSGHTSIMILVTLTIINEKLINPSYNHLLIIVCLIYSGLILSSRNHYTVDVILAYIISISVYYNLKNSIM